MICFTGLGLTTRLSSLKLPCRCLAVNSLRGDSMVCLAVNSLRGDSMVCLAVYSLRGDSMFWSRLKDLLPREFRELCLDRRASLFVGVLASENLGESSLDSSSLIKYSDLASESLPESCLE